MNRIVLMGRFTKDPDVRSTGETHVARFNLAVDRRVKGEDKADFIPCVAFGRTAEFIENYFRQGSRILVEGRLQSGSYEKDGKKVYTLDVVVENAEFCENKKAESAEPPKPNPMSSFMDITDSLEDDGLPFIS